MSTICIILKQAFSITNILKIMTIEGSANGSFARFDHHSSDTLSRQYEVPIVPIVPHRHEDTAQTSQMKTRLMPLALLRAGGVSPNIANL